MAERLLVVGGDAAGMSAASQARRRKGPGELEIVAFDRGHHFSYSACGIPYLVGDVVPDVGRLIVRTPEQFMERHSITALVRHEVTAIDLDRGRLEVRDLEAGASRWEGFDLLMYAAGGVPRAPELTNRDAEGIFGVQVLDDGVAIKRFIASESPRRAVVVGGGYIGLEMAEAFVERGLEVVLVEKAPEPMSTLDPDMGRLVHDALEEVGVEVHTGEAVTGFEVGGGRVTAVVTESRTIPADIVVLGLGTGPNAGLARDAGIEIGPSGGVAVDQQMQTSAPNVWAGGDCAEKFHLVSRSPVTIPLGTHANKEGRVAGINIGGGYATFPGVVGTAVTKVCGIEIGRTGLTEKEAAGAGFDFETSTVDSTTRAGYFPGKQPIKTKMLVERRSGRLLGGQIVGKEDAAKRIDVIATALWNEMTVAQMLNLDLGYAPPFSPLWDPVLIAARKAFEKVEASLRPDDGREGGMPRS